MWELAHKEGWEWRINAFEFWCWRRLLRVLWTARRSNQSILKEINPEYSLEGLMLKRKLQYFGHLMGRADSFEKTLMLGEIEGGRRRGWQRMRWLDGVIDSVDMSLCILREMLKEREAWHAVVHGVTNSRTRLSDWTTKTRSQINESFIDLLQSAFSTTCLSHVFWGSWTQFQCMSVCIGLGLLPISTSNSQDTRWRPMIQLNSDTAHPEIASGSRVRVQSHRSAPSALCCPTSVISCACDQLARDWRFWWF